MIPSFYPFPIGPEIHRGSPRTPLPSEAPFDEARSRSLRVFWGDAKQHKSHGNITVYNGNIVVNHGNMVVNW